MLLIPFSVEQKEPTGAELAEDITDFLVTCKSVSTGQCPCIDERGEKRIFEGARCEQTGITFTTLQKYVSFAIL